MKWPTLRIFKKIVLPIAPRILAHAIVAHSTRDPKQWQEPNPPHKTKRVRWIAQRTPA